MLFQSRQRSAASLQKELDSDFFLPGATRLRRAETRHVQDIGKIRPGGISRNTCQNVSSLRQQFALLSHRGEIASTTVRKGNAEGVSHEGCVILDSGSRKNSRGRLILGGTGPSKMDSGTDTSSSTSVSGNDDWGTQTDPRSRRPSSSSCAHSVSLRPDNQSLLPPNITCKSRQVLLPESQVCQRKDIKRQNLASTKSVQQTQPPAQAQVRSSRPNFVRRVYSRHDVTSNMTGKDTLTRPNGGPSNDVCTEADRGRMDVTTSDDKKAPSPSSPRPFMRSMSPRKWNHLGRSHSQPPTANRALQPMSPVAVAVRFPANFTGKKKPVAFYTVFDSSDQDDEDANAGDLLREACILGSQRASSFSHSKKRPSLERLILQPNTSLTQRRQQRNLFKRQPEIVEQPGLQQKQRKLQLLQTANKHSVQKVPVSHLAEATFPTVSFFSQTTTDLQKKSSNKIPRIERVHETASAGSLGRISPKSFSRPFRRVSVQLSSSLAPLIKPLSTESDTDESFLPINLIPEFILDGPIVSGRNADAMYYDLCQSQNLLPEADCGNIGNKAPIDPLETFWDTSTTNSSGLLSLTHAVAVVPDPSAPLEEDEIWDEYNDLFGEVEEQTEVGFSASSLNEAQLYPKSQLEKENTEPLVASAYPISQLQTFTTNSPTAASPNKVVDRIYSQLPPAPFVSGRADQNCSAAILLPRTKRCSRQSRKKATRVSDSDICSQNSKDDSMLSQVKLRVSSMTVSRWLTFGQVLFSPAHDGIVKAVSAPNGHSVLVIDGLGNDDWSFYAAETYPAAEFFNLSARAPQSVDRHCNVLAFPLSPPNHHQVRYTLCADKFPFGPESFHTVVFRFPAVAPTSHYKNIVDEAYRVLKPGGYLELSILDFDLNNMGPRTRRAVNQLKERLHCHSPNLHPGSAADAILHFVSMSRFADIKSCRVGIPAASCGFSPSKDTIGPRFGARPRNNLCSHPGNAALGHSKNSDDGESITSRVVRVGRWWHSQCYGDAALIPNSRQTTNETGSSDMWMDRALIRECEEWQTSFKFTVCYARVPVEKCAESI